MSDTNNEGIYSKHVVELLTVANEFCKFTEEGENYSDVDLLEFYQKVCPLLYLKGSLVKPLAVNDLGANEKFVTEEEWESVYTMLKDKFGKDDAFLEIQKDEITGTKLIEVHLSEKIADVYQDMKDFVLLYQKNTRDAKENAVNDICQYFVTHWGKRIIQIQATAHEILATKKGL